MKMNKKTTFDVEAVPNKKWTTNKKVVHFLLWCIAVVTQTEAITCSVAEN